MTELLETALSLPAPVVWLVLLFSSGVEYLFPPFPGDAVVLAGAVVVGGQSVSFIPVVIAVTLGSVGGAALDYELGRWLSRPGTDWLHSWFERPRVNRVLLRISEGFERHGDLYLLVNRFLPGVRAFFFVAAGYAGLKRSRTLVLATLAAMLWNALILCVGLVIGSNLEALLAFSASYSKQAWFVMVVGCVVIALRAAIRR